VIDYSKESSTITPLGIHRRLGIQGGHNEISIAIKLLRDLGVLEKTKVAGSTKNDMVMNRENLEKYFQIEIVKT